MKRALYAVILGVGLLPILAAQAASSPVPSPSPSPTGTPLSPALSTILAPAPSTAYVPADKTVKGVIEGAFNAQQYVAFGSTADPTGAKATLQRDGFIAGFGHSWVERTTERAIVEVVVAFSGNLGAKDWMSVSQVADKSDPSYKNSISATGLSSYYGAHFVNSSSKTYADELVFVKGNDFYFIAVASINDDVLAVAQAQALAQYKAAPAYTVPPAKWPKQAPATKSTTNFLAIAIRAIISILLIAGLGAGAFLVIRRSRRYQNAYSTDYGPASTIPAPAFQLSPDGDFWWDGEVWRDAATDMPTAAQRSDDGAFWWDGGRWRPVPQAPAGLGFDL